MDLEKQDKLITCGFIVAIAATSISFLLALSAMAIVVFKMAVNL